MSASSLVVAVVVAVAVVCARGGRVVSASRTRHLAVPPPRFLAIAAATHSRSLMCLYRTPYIVMPLFHFSFSSYAEHVLLHLYSLRVAARIFAFPSHCSRVRRAAAPSVVSLNTYVFAEQFASHLCSVATKSICVARPLHSDQISRYRLARRASRA